MNFIEYLTNCTSSYQTVTTTARILDEAGYSELPMSEKWSLEKGRGYYVKIYETCIAAFFVGEDYRDGDGMRIAAAHTDQPCIRIKPGDTIADNGYVKLNVEVYGGAILNTWLDRPLSVAGIATVANKDEITPIFIDLKRPLMTIPNLAIHMNREVNKGVEINKQTELMPIIGLIKDELSKDNILLELIAKETGCDLKDILSFDLCVYNCDKPELIGINNEMLSAPRIDNLSSCYACVKALIESEGASSLNIAILFDNEETGSVSKQGADSDVLSILVRKIYNGLNYSERVLNGEAERFDINSIDEACFKSLMLSVDVAHAYHPNYGGKYDPVNKCIMGKGAVLKLNFTQKYATDALALAQLKKIADKENIKLQEFVNRSDLAGGGTLGSMLSAHMPIRCVDLGVGILAMHSSRELMAYEDEETLWKLISGVYRSGLNMV